MVASAFAEVIPRAVAMASPVVAPGAAIEIPITPPVLAKVPTAVTLPPVVVPAAIPLPAIMRMPSTPELVAPARLTLPYALTVTPLVVPEFLIKAPVIILPLKPSANRFTPAPPVIVAPATVRMPSLAKLANVDVPVKETKPLVVLDAATTPAAALPWIP